MEKRLLLNTAISAVLATGIAVTFALNTTEYYDLGIKTASLGNYEITIESHETPSHETLPIIEAQKEKYFPSSELTVQTEVDNVAPYAVYSATPITKVDVVFATGDLTQLTSYTNYMKSFTSLVTSQNSSLDVLVNEVKTEESRLSSTDYNIDSILNSWTKVGANVWSSRNGEMYCRLPGGSSVGTGSWQATALLCPDADDSKDITFEFTVDAKSSDLMEGVCWRVTKNSDGTYNGYFLNVGTHWHQGISLMKFEHCDLAGDFRSGDLGRTIWCGFTGPSWASMTHGWCEKGTVSGNSIYTTANGHKATVTHLATYSNELTGKVKVVMKGTYIQVYYNNNLIMSAYDSQFSHGTYGFWGNNCETNTSMSVTDISIITEKLVKKSLGEAISDVSWRADSIRFVVYAIDSVPVECVAGAEDDFQYTIAKLMNCNAYLVCLGTSTNINELNSILTAIKQADGTPKGKFYYNNPITTAMNSAAKYIVDTASTYVNTTNWVLINTEILWNTTYSDSEEDPPLNFAEHNGTKKQPQDKSDITLASLWSKSIVYKYSEDKILAEKWRYKHNPNYFDNAIGTASFSGNWISDPIETFEFTGRYRINYKRRDNPFYTDESLTNLFDDYRYWSTNYDMKIHKTE